MTDGNFFNRPRTELPALTREQAAILSAYTGILCGSFRDLHEYAEITLNRAVWTHEFGTDKFAAELRNAAHTDMMRIVNRA